MAEPIALFGRAESTVPASTCRAAKAVTLTMDRDRMITADYVKAIVELPADNSNNRQIQPLFSVCGWGVAEAIMALLLELILMRASPRHWS